MPEAFGQSRKKVQAAHTSLSARAVRPMCTLLLSFFLTAAGDEAASSRRARMEQASKPTHIIAINYSAWYPKGWWNRSGADGYGHVWRVREGVCAEDRPNGVNPEANPVKPLFQPYTDYGGWNEKAVKWDIQQARRAGMTSFAMPISHGLKKEYHLMGDAILSENFGLLVMADFGLSDEELVGYLRRWISHPSYLRIDGRPVVWVYGGSNLANRERVEREIGERIYAIGSHGRFRVDVLSGYSSIADIFDPSGRAEPRYPDLSRRGVTFAPIMTAMFTAGGQSISWNANRWRRYWEIVVRYPQNNPHAVIYAVIWNEIFETSLIVPTREYGYEPVEVTREMVEKLGLVKRRVSPEETSLRQEREQMPGESANLARNQKVTTTGDPQHGWPLSNVVDGDVSTQVDISLDKDEELRVTFPAGGKELGRIIVREGSGGDVGYDYVLEVHDGEWQVKARYKYGGRDAVRTIDFPPAVITGLRIRHVSSTPGVEMYFREVAAYRAR